MEPCLLVCASLATHCVPSQLVQERCCPSERRRAPRKTPPGPCAVWPDIRRPCPAPPRRLAVWAGGRQGTLGEMQQALTDPDRRRRRCSADPLLTTYVLLVSMEAVVCAEPAQESAITARQEVAGAHPNRPRIRGIWKNVGHRQPQQQST